MEDLPELDRQLARWTAPAPPSDLDAQVWQKLAHRRFSPFRRFWERWFAQPAFLAMTGVSAFLLALFLVELRAVRVQREHNRQLAESYLRMIDPLLGPAPAGDVENQLGWMKSELGLTAAQFALVRSLHAASGPQLRTYAAQLADLRRTHAEIERRWRSDNQVDFVAYAQMIDRQRTVDQSCAASFRRLIDSAAAVMNPAQRERYLALLRPLLTRVGVLSHG